MSDLVTLSRAALDDILREIRGLKQRLGGNVVPQSIGRTLDHPFPALAQADILNGAVGPIQRQKNIGSITAPSFTDAGHGTEQAYNETGATITSGARVDVYREPSRGGLVVVTAAAPAGGGGGTGGDCTCNLYDLQRAAIYAAGVEDDAYDSGETIGEALERMAVDCGCYELITCNVCKNNEKPSSLRVTASLNNRTPDQNASEADVGVDWASLMPDSVVLDSFGPIPCMWGDEQTGSAQAGDSVFVTYGTVVGETVTTRNPDDHGGFNPADIPIGTPARLRVAAIAIDGTFAGLHSSVTESTLFVKFTGQVQDAGQWVYPWTQAQAESSVFPYREVPCRSLITQSNRSTTPFNNSFISVASCKTAPA